MCDTFFYLVWYWKFCPGTNLIHSILLNSPWIFVNQPHSCLVNCLKGSMDFFRIFPILTWKKILSILKISLWEYNLYRTRNNQSYMISENQRCKTVALLKSLKNIYVLIFWIHIPESIFKSNIYKIRY